MVITFVAIYICLLQSNASPGKAFAESGIPPDIAIEGTYQPGFGEPVGKIVLTRGDAIILHEGNKRTGYSAGKNLPIYNDDTLITGENGRVSIGLADGSRISLASNTRLKIDKAIYDPKKTTRFSLISLFNGKARFWVKKLVDFKRSGFTVKTKTAVLGVRGSDFVVEATETYTKVSNMKDTVLEAVNLFARCQGMEDLQDCEVKQRVIDEYKKVVIKKHDIELKVEKLPGHEIEAIDNEFPEVTDSDEPMIEMDVLIPGEELDTSIPEFESVELTRPEFDTVSGDSADTLDQADEITENIRENADLPDYPSRPETSF